MTTPLDSPRALWRATTLADRLLCAGILAGSIGLAVGGRAGSIPASRAVVIVGRVVQSELPLDRESVHTFAGRMGPVTVSVRHGAVAVTESTCPHRVCMEMGWKNRSGDVIACVPNELLVRVEGGPLPAGMPDAVTR